MLLEVLYQYDVDTLVDFQKLNTSEFLGTCPLGFCLIGCEHVAADASLDDYESPMRWLVCMKADRCKGMVNDQKSNHCYCIHMMLLV